MPLQQHKPHDPAILIWVPVGETPPRHAFAASGASTFSFLPDAIIHAQKDAAHRPESLFECAISRIYADSAVSALSLEQALAHKSGCPLLARSLWAGFRQPRRQRVFGQATGIPHSNRL